MSQPQALVHHFVPAAILGEWSPGLSAHKVPRKRPIRCFIKNHQMHGTRLVSAESVCNRRGLYLLPAYSNPRDTGLMYVTLDSVLKRGVPEQTEHEEFEDYLERIAADPLCLDRYRRDFAERELAVMLDGPMVSLARKLREGLNPRRSDLKLIRRFMVLSSLRHPNWLARNAQDEINRSNDNASSRLFNKYPPSVWMDPLALRQKEILGDVFQVLSLLRMVRSSFENPSVRTNLLLLESKGPARFVTSDNPCRPYQFTDGRVETPLSWPGLWQPGAVISLPIGPNHCILWRGAETGSPPYSRGSASEELVRLINTATAKHALLHVILPSDGDDFFSGGESSWAQPWDGDQL